ncbi:CGNR zinc finger domain-containing protein [Phytoactinopolyspora limicola]|uniref:CGNR zinc finger domain-containing protein n=1 Tax=Phytoactinopolyspora limicola TaxID=2715536 RepID=UPI001A9C9399|nr:ABATE domain-containing protein [Phytoactinopolyspora limicola]
MSNETAAPAVGPVLPDEPAPVLLMNTIWADRSGVHDALDSPAGLRNWLTATGVELSAEAPPPTHTRRFRELRDAVRRIAAAITDDSRTAAASPTTDIEQAIQVINAAALRSPLVPQLAWEDGRARTAATSPADAVDAALSATALAAISLLGGADHGNLRACYAPGCVLYFVKNHPRREWCSASCGNRARVARHYRRRHGGG